MTTAKQSPSNEDISANTKKESDATLPRLFEGSSTSTLGRLNFLNRRGDVNRRRPTKNEELLEKSKFHLLRSYEQKLKLEEEKRLAIEKHKKRQSFRGAVLGDLEELSPSVVSADSPLSPQLLSPSLPSIRE